MSDLTRAVIPKAIQWQREYNDRGNRSLDGLARDVLDLRINSVLHFLQKYSMWMCLYESAPYDVTEFLPPIVAIASTWLASAGFTNGMEDSLPQTWKCAFKFHLGVGISALFELLKYCVDKPYYDDMLIISQVSSCCERILSANSEIVPIAELGTQAFTNLWITRCAVLKEKLEGLGIIDMLPAQNDRVQDS